MQRLNIIKDQIKPNLTSTCGKDKPNGPNAPSYLKFTPSTEESRLSGGTSHMLPEERKQATFDSEEMQDYLNGGKEATKRKKFIQSVLSKNYHDFHDSYNNTREEYLAESVRRFVTIHKAYKNFKPTRQDIGYMAEVSIGYGSLNNSHGIFLQTIQGQGSAEQSKFWVPKVLNFEITGSYAQTELGHGSNVRGLTTTATFDVETDEFVLNTPTLRSIKWWPGALGKASTHCTLYAQLLINGKEHGLAVFMLQLRDENFLPLKGVRVGDLGMKVGDNANDTGYLILENVRIPREYMLCKYKTVTREGKFEIVANTDPKVHYTTMIQTRAMMCNTAAGRLAQSSCIAVRYSAVRTQGFVDTKPGLSYTTKEHKIIDHQIQQYRLFRQLATAYGLKFTAQWMVEQQSMIEGKEVGVIKNTSLLKELAASSAGLKSLTSQIATAGSEDLRKTCGGNGYLLNSGIAALTCDYLWQVTAEGDMIILALSTARHIVTSIGKTLGGKNLQGVLDYFNVINTPDFNLRKIRPDQATNTDIFYNLDFLLSLFRYRSIEKNLLVTKEFNKLITKDKVKFEVAWDMCSSDLLSATYSHCYYIIMLNFVNKVKENKNEKIKKVLSELCVLFACSQIVDNNWGDTLSTNEFKYVKKVINKVMKDIRPNAIALVDAFGIPDGELNSTIGRHDGNVYEALVDAAQRSTLNQDDPFDGYKYLKPHLNTKLLKHGNKKNLGVKF